MGRQCRACKGTGRLTGDTLRERMEKLKCRDCRNHHEGYMVRDSVWREEAGLQSYGMMLCVHCLEKRLGRKLGVEDFTAAPINSLFEFGYRLGVGDRYLFRDSSGLADAALELADATSSEDVERLRAAQELFTEKVRQERMKRARKSRRSEGAKE